LVNFETHFKFVLLSRATAEC